MKKFPISIHIIIWAIIIFTHMKASSQCAMCRAVLESEDGQRAAEGINNGITYLMVIPYILVAFVGYQIYKGRK